ncbi:MAG: VWA domain-containing protein [Epsilonproteobacteria bacterium]|nr:VWA domain-containing protein [Campylobacterota bacterium]
MKFLHPEFLYFMTIPLIILFALLLTQKESSLSFFSENVIDKLRVATNTLTLKARNALFFLAGFFMIVALSEPVIPNGKITIAKKSADILIALDISNSMLAQDIYPSRIEAAKQKALELIGKIKEDRVGVIAFAKSAYLVSPLSFDKEAVAFLLKNLDTTSITQQGTSFLSLLQTVHKSSKRTKKKYVVIFSDGGDQKDFSKEIAYAKAHNITVFVMAFGTKKGAPIPLENGEFLSYKGKIVITHLNQAITKLALETGGVYVEALSSHQDVNALVKELASVVAKKELKTKAIEKYIPLFYLPLGAAMLLILVALSSMSKREKVEVPSMFLLVIVLSSWSVDTKAFLLDFRDLEQAKEAYANREYRKSGKSFEAYARSQNTPEAYYNAGNAYYKAGDYHTALGMYEKVHKASASLRAKTYANMGNSYAQLHQYEKALEAYKESLKINYDADVAHNKEMIEQLLQQKKQQQNKQSKKDQHHQQEQQKAQSKPEQKNQQAQQHKQQGQQDQQDQQGQQGQQGQQKQQQTQNVDKNVTKQDHLQKKKQSSLSQKNDTNTTQQVMQQKKASTMSDAEERKWLEYLNQDNKTFLYKMDEQNSLQRGMNDEKPW